MGMDHVNGSPILTTDTANVRCQCVVDLISRAQRPYLFRVTVTGEFPHNVERIYDISATSDDAAARKGLDLFVHEMSHPLRIFGAMM
jgi:hypothetical protein